jgi:hypothetical protein
MIHPRRAVGLILLAVAMLLPGASAVAAKDHGVPFKADFAGSAGFSGPTTTVFAGSGNASHLGRISSSGFADISCFPSDPTSTSCVPGGCPGGVPNVQTETFTAANGDTLTILSQDVACPTGPSQYHGMGVWTVTGGTGRFADATGNGTLDGHSDFAAGTFDAVLDGSIAY